MHNQKVYLSSGSRRQNSSGDIYGSANLGDVVGVFDLKPIERIRPIFDFSNAEIFVGVLNDVGEQGHLAAIVAAFVSNAEAKNRRSSRRPPLQRCLLDEFGGSCDVQWRFNLGMEYTDVPTQPEPISWDTMRCPFLRHRAAAKRKGVHQL